jgi:acyl-ACP thioesterase
MQKKYVYHEKFKIKTCEVDFKDELKISTALALMEEVACASAEELGFGYSFVKPNGYAFMVAGVRLELLRPVCLGETVEVNTWPTPPSFAVFGREYQMKSEVGQTLVNASSRWCLVDLKTNKILQSKTVQNQDYSTYNTDKLFDTITWKIPVFNTEEKTPSFTITIANAEYDHNMHVNNTRYADYCLNCFSVEFLSRNRLTDFQIAYIKQCKEGQTLRFYRDEKADGEYALQGVNEENEIVVQALAKFVKDR